MDDADTGIIKQWNDVKGFGFIKADVGGDVFFHISALQGNSRPKIGDSVTYVKVNDDKGRTAARCVRLESLSMHKFHSQKNPFTTSVKNSPSRKISPLNLGAKLFVFVLLLVPSVVGMTQLWVRHNIEWTVYLYSIASFFAFYLYWSDKQRARSDARRIPEVTLHTVALLGGWTGALIAQQLFRHKTRKISFQFMFWLIVITHELFWLDQIFYGGKYFGGIH